MAGVSVEPGQYDGGSPNGDLEPESERCQALRKLIPYKLYRRRWYFLAVVCLLNASNAMIWITFAPVADLTASYFNCSPDTVNSLSLVYLIVSILIGSVASWFLDTFGLKYAVILSSWLNMAGSVIRCLSLVSFFKHSLNPLLFLFLGQSVCAIAQPLVLFVPAKLAAVWFPENQRARANMIASMSNPLGIFLVNLLSPIIASEVQYVPLVIGIFGIPAVVACVLATAGIPDSAPPTPPSASAINSNSEPFFTGLKQLLKNKAYVILMICFGTGLGIFTAFSSFLEQILCFRGYPNYISGLCGALYIFAGAIGALVFGLYVDRTKKFTEVVKICFALTALSLTAFAVISNLRNQPVLLAVICSLLGFFCFGQYPITMELAVECSYPVGEASSTGLAFISGQVQGLIYMVVFQTLAKPYAAPLFSSCGVNQIEIYDWSIPTLLMAGLCSLAACTVIIFFHTDYKRLAAEEDAEERVISINDGDGPQP